MRKGTVIGTAFTVALFIAGFAIVAGFTPPSPPPAVNQPVFIPATMPNTALPNATPSRSSGC